MRIVEKDVDSAIRTTPHCLREGNNQQNSSPHCATSGEQHNHFLYQHYILLELIFHHNMGQCFTSLGFNEAHPHVSDFSSWIWGLLTLHLPLDVTFLLHRDNTNMLNLRRHFWTFIAINNQDEAISCRAVNARRLLRHEAGVWDYFRCWRPVITEPVYDSTKSSHKARLLLSISTFPALYLPSTSLRHRFLLR